MFADLIFGDKEHVSSLSRNTLPLDRSLQSRLSKGNVDVVDLLDLLFRLEIQRRGVHAITHAGRRRTVREDVA